MGPHLGVKMSLTFGRLAGYFAFTKMSRDALKAFFTEVVEASPIPVSIFARVSLFRKPS